ncbi:MAG TPA: aldose 1-epimerase family protein [Fibrobacteria bacterium]|nr:aldose 1-epimerase family protein [Fibrobacteria bacterium]
MSPVLLKNESIEVHISPLGAELRGLRRLDTGVEYMWSGDPAFWARVSPILFPVVGRLANDAYTWQGRRYSLPQHGFARDLEFDVVHEDEQEASFLLGSAGPFLDRYPQQFQLAVSYALDGNALKLRYDVFNPSSTDDLLFSLGAHPAFRWPLAPQVPADTYHLSFEHTEAADRLEVGIDGLLTGKKVPFFRDVDQLKLRPDLFRAGAVVLEGLKSDSIRFGADEGPAVRLTAPGASWWGFWTHPGASFLCLEPWHGVADKFGADWDLRGKPGIIALPPGDSWSWNLRIEAL